MGIQAIALTEEDVRGTLNGSPTFHWLPVTGSLFPTFNATDESRPEFRGNDSALGNSESSLVRRESQITYALECVMYPGAEIGLLFKHLLGKSNTRVTEDTSGFKGLVYPLSQAYGTDNELGTKAIGVMVLFDKEGTTYKQYYGGLRPFDCNVAGEGTDDVKMTLNMKAPGEYALDAEVNDLTPDYSGLTDPFTAQDISCYVGTGATLTGTAPDYTDIDPNTMTQFCPDSVNFTITSGNDDKVQLCGVQGPDKTFRSSQFAGELTLPIDLADPSSGFSSWDEYDKIFGGVNSNIFMLVLDNGILAGAATANYETTFFFPAMLSNPDTPDIAPDGTQPIVTLNYSSLYDTTSLKPFFIQTIDKASAY